MQQERNIRINKIINEMLSLQAEACLLSTTVNTYYLHQRIFNGYTYLSSDGKMVVFVKRPIDITAEDLHLNESHLHFIRKPEQIPALLGEMQLPLPESLLLEGSDLSYGDWMRLQQCFPSTRLINGSTALRKARSIKTEWELDQLRLSAQLHQKAYRHIPEVFRDGMSEWEFCIEVEHLMRQEGCLGLFRSFGKDMESFMGSLLAGDNAAVSSPYDFALGGAGHSSNPVGSAYAGPLSAQRGNHIIGKGQSILIDMCGNFTGYLNDMSRCYSNGKLPERAYYAHQTALEIQSFLQENLKEGSFCDSLYEQTLKIVSDRHLSACFMGTKQQAKFVGHGVGLVINELPVLAKGIHEVLLPGMAIALEPKFIIEGVGAVGIENTFIVGKDSCEKLASLTDDIIDLTTITK